MAANTVRRIDAPTPPDRAPKMEHHGGPTHAASSPVAAMQHRIEQAALKGFFDKRPKTIWHGGYRRLAVVAGAAAGAWIAVFAAIYAGMH